MPEETLKDPIASRKRAMSKKGRQKGHAANFLASFFVLHKVGNQKKTAKKSPWPLIWLATKKRRQKVAGGKKTLKGRLGNKVGKKSWHLRSPLVNHRKSEREMHRIPFIKDCRFDHYFISI